MDTLAETVPDTKAKTPLDTQSNIKSQALMDRLADTELFADTATCVDADTQLETMHDNLVEADVNTLGDRLSDVKYEDRGTNGHVGRHSSRGPDQHTW